MNIKSLKIIIIGGCRIMFSYEIFKEMVAEKILSYMPEKYQDMEVVITPVVKVNNILDGMSFRETGEKSGKSISPTVYINYMYEDYLKKGNLQEVLQQTADEINKAFYKASKIQDIKLENAKDNIVFQLINTIQNEEMLRTVPHREMQDLSIIYRWIVNVDENDVSSAIINNELIGP